jgi:hypothetical protein
MLHALRSRLLRCCRHVTQLRRRVRPPWAHLATPSPERIARIHAGMRRNASRQRMWLSASQTPYEFVLSATQPGVGPNAAAPPIRRDSIRFSLTSATGGDESSHVRLLPDAPQPLETPNPCNTIGVFKAGVAIDRHALPAGLYTLSAHADVDPFVLPDGDNVADAHADLQGWRIYVPPPATAAPALRIGQRFLVFPEANTTYYDASGIEIPRGDVTMRVATLVQTGARKLTFAVAGYARHIVTDKDGAPTQISGLTPLVDDGNVRRLNAIYDGRKVWGRGGLGADCVLRDAGGTWSGGGPNSRPFTVVHVFRTYRSSYELAIGSQVGAISGGRQSSFEDESPLVVVLDVPGDTTFSAVGGTGSIGVRSRSANAAPAPVTSAAPVRLMGPNPECAAYYTYFADAWDMNRAYSLTPPPYPQTGVKTGMTHEQVSWQIGYPAEYGTPAELDRLNAWRYDNLPPFSYWVYFGPDGRVTKFGPDGQLP